MFLGVSGNVGAVDIQNELSDAERAIIAARLQEELRTRFKGNKKAAYTEAGVNPLTWDRALRGDKVRRDRLVQIVTNLWPESRGDWDLVPAVGSVRRPLFQSDADALAALSDWVRNSAQKGSTATAPPTEALLLWDFDQLLEALAAKHEEELALKDRQAEQYNREAEDLAAELHRRGGDGDADATAGGSAPTTGDYDLAAHDEEHTIEEEQEHPDTP